MCENVHTKGNDEDNNNNAGYDDADFPVTRKLPAEVGRNKLFLVCPLCQMENFIASRYDRAFFLTAPAAVFRFEQDESQIIHEFILREHITDVYLVAETSCNFTNLVLEADGFSGRYCEFEIGKLKTDRDTIESLATKLLRYEAGKMQSREIFREDFLSGKYALHLLLVSKQKQRMQEISLEEF